jgi:hypothetical protein
MSKSFSPVHLEVYNPEAKRNNFGDIWAITCAQLGETLKALSEVQDEVAFKKEDLVGYYQLQYGIDTDVIEDTLDFAFEEGMHFRKQKIFNEFFRLVPDALKDKTTPATMERIMLGQPEYADRVIPADVTDLMEIREEKSATGGDIKSLYPTKETSMTYRGRVTHSLGNIIIGNLIEETKIHADTVNLSNKESSNIVVVLSQEGHTDYGEIIQELRIL